MSALKSEEIATASWKERRISGQQKDGRAYRVEAPDIHSEPAVEVVAALRSSSATFVFETPPLAPATVSLLAIVSFPLLIIVLVFLFVVRPTIRAISGRPGP